MFAFAMVVFGAGLAGAADFFRHGRKQAPGRLCRCLNGLGVALGCVGALSFLAYIG